MFLESLIAKISVVLVPGLLAITLHEIAHGYLAERFGDPTARLLGRLTFNPLRHLDPIGTVALLYFGFGWARPVPVNFNNLRNPHRDMIWVALAGPAANFSLAILSALVLRLLAMTPASLAGDPFLSRILEPLELMTAASLYINVILAFFNLIPIPPLDGGRVLSGLLPPRGAQMLARFELAGFILVLLLIFFTDLWRLLLVPVSALVGLLAGPALGTVQKTIYFITSR